MAICMLCNGDMRTAVSCIVDALHVHGRHVELDPHFRPRGGPGDGRCGDCGVLPGGFHHLGCDLQRCPLCHRQLLTCQCHFDEFDGALHDGYDEDAFDDDDDADDWSFPPGEPLGVDSAGNPTERVMMGDQEVILHHGDVPESDITVHKGIRCTTPLRTIIDCAPEMPDLHLLEAVQDCLERELFTVAEAWRRIREPDMANHPGAHRLRRVLPPQAA